MDILIHRVVVINGVERSNMMELNNQKMYEVEGGTFTSTMLNAISKAINTLYELGKQTGSALRRIAKNSYCPLN